MYPGTGIGRKIKIPCTRVHGFEEKQNLMYLHESEKKDILMCSSGGGGGPEHL